jgi:hypothetical protein
VRLRVSRLSAFSRAVCHLFFLLFRLFARIEDLERQLTRFVRAQALKDLEKKP